ncbi:putative methyltransferase [Dinoroseobacter shibae DFL 12 = DSM 16493]|jgi:predicted O-methyltransferase YrrM|uniref:Putative methyltransferase n=1 Tax=Dinoroseobacter shibae (strain DSM 16493 / NCIMB 14021 / DFL 12) TaxID=398580 RepID=A8LP03_DINSH|nr:class I SAM-dependent methyltransferase [Dinoroseobacter shibae]ABV93685.1 putative methyltransferase [Dinoroseobacter shibae DFL 12 = DSM 16493]URF45138.1 class I SAM-dependent methyltransferase [Dinoroseobacter shibae]URF49443.1 class I SAM-dependent methyltransferase [Dinoroseobacter shibae]
MKFKDYFYTQDIYAGFDMDQVAPDTQGWGSTAGIFAKLLDELKPAKIVEVGTWKGASAIHMAKLCAEAGIETDILCIDTFLGASGLWLRPGYAEEMLKTKNGMPTIFPTFLRNVIDAGLTDVITPLPLPSREAATVLVKRRIRADLIYIDGDHSYEGCLEDLRNYRPALAPEGLMLADDYTFDGVNRAITEFVDETGCEMLDTGNKVVLSFGRDITGLRDWQAEMAEKRAAMEARKAAAAAKD